MHYCTRADIGNAIPELTLIQLSNDDPSAMQPNESVIEDGVRQAEELVDGYLRGRYTLPLDPVPTVLRGLWLVLFWSMEIAGESPSMLSISGFSICPRNWRA